MWLNPETLTVYRTHSEIRSAWPKTLFPGVMTDDMVLSIGLAPVKPSEPPEYDPLLQTAEETAPIQIDGQWTQRWTVRDLTTEERKARVPTVVTMRQARLALLQAGLLNQVDVAIAALEDPVQRSAARVEWEYATEVNREYPWVRILAVALELTEQRLDDLFTLAKTL